MKTITQQKPFEEIKEYLEEHDKIYLVGCGTCATMCRTGGKEEVLKMKADLSEIGKTVTGWMVIPTACDELTREALNENIKSIEEADAILVMACAFGVQTVARYTDKPVYPALDTLFVGREETPGVFSEVCMQCGECILGWTGGVCPITSCPKGLINGPCGGYRHGMCEVDPEKECAWAQIYDRLKRMGQLDRFSALRPVKDYSKLTRPRKKTIEL